MRFVLLPLLACAALSAPAAAADMIVGVVAPTSGPSAILGQQVVAGSRVAAAKTSALKLEVVDDACTADGGRQAAEKLVAAKAAVVIGFLCTESIEAALPALKEANIPVITVGVRTDSLTDRKQKTGWPVWRLAPRADAEREAVGAILTRKWRDALFAIIDDGTIYGREMAETLRSTAEQAALKPVFVDTFRPQLENQIGLIGRLRKAGATHVFAGGDAEDIAVLGRDAAALGANLIIAGGEALRSAPGPVPMAAGTLMVGLPELSDRLPPDIATELESHGVVPEGYVLPAYAAIQIATAALATVGQPPVANTLTSETFDTVVGTVDFDDKGDLATNPYRLFRFDGSKFIEAQD